MRRFPPSPLLLALGTLVLVACAGGEGMPSPDVTSALTPTATGTPPLVQSPDSPRNLTATPTPTPPQPTTGDSSLPEGDSTVYMKAALAYLTTPPPLNDFFIDVMGDSGDTSFVPVLVDLLFWRFYPPVKPTQQIRLALTKLTGENFESWPDWFIWLGRHQEIEAPPLYAEFKSELFERVDPRISLFFYDGVKARIRLEEIVWGGVRRDGIPDLNDAPIIPAGEATYLNPDDRVFGVSINGEHRAYPLRIMNPHEMANDVLGGEPIALAY